MTSGGLCVVLHSFFFVRVLFLVFSHNRRLFMSPASRYRNKGVFHGYSVDLIHNASHEYFIEGSA